MEREVDVAIIGAGTAGLFALRQVKRVTDSYVVIDGGQLGTTCARVGCMPSKVMIQTAEDHHHRHALAYEGIEGGMQIALHSPRALEYVRKMRDSFVEHVMGGPVSKLGDKLIRSHARFRAPGVIEVEGSTVRAKRVIVATGSRPVVPRAWQAFGDRVITTDQLFEQPSLPNSMAVLGLGVIGLELGQALARLGVEVTGVEMLQRVGGLGDDDVNAAAVEAMREEFPIWLGEKAQLAEGADGRVRVSAGDKSVEVDQVLVAAGRTPNVDGLGLDMLGLELDDRGVPAYDPETMKVPGAPIYIAGDANAELPLQHEARDEGQIAGYNAARGTAQCFRRRAPLSIVFSQPNVVTVGESWEKLAREDVLVGTCRFDGDQRSRIKHANRGVARIYADRRDGRLRGASMAAPDGEHLGHLFALAIQQGLTAVDVLRMPFYHPTVEERVQDALREIAGQTERQPDQPVDLELLHDDAQRQAAE
ncbi:dihydrolipoyl dehydrogenase [Rhodovibrio salinarum]|uniref:Dihydrolipoyl dehydrogenase n=1 Tax=Rhodovibrio salinarum TaxID=1087 RepID=A0A934V0S3_9PROT|nr:dihydrolipoyl dehydrogenase [Rhodovibrio salinarum]MBK1698248.1 dihydrolipoyl dehydrogenase [Rhodovibrio salinarum]